MGRRRPRTKATPTELARVQKILEEQPAFAAHLGPKKPIEKRTGEVVSFHVGAFGVVEAVIQRNLNPERSRTRVVLRVVCEVFGISGRNET